VQSALQSLELTLLKASFDDTALAIGRLLAHFPSRDVTKDWVIISDLSNACIENGFSLIAIVEACDCLWKKATFEKPFLPPTGEILNEIISVSNYYNRYYERLKNGQGYVDPNALMKEHNFGN